MTKIILRSIQGWSQRRENRLHTLHFLHPIMFSQQEHLIWSAVQDAMVSSCKSAKDIVKQVQETIPPQHGITARVSILKNHTL